MSGESESDPAEEWVPWEGEGTRQKELECLALERVKPWCAPEKDDYGFFAPRSWAKDASEEVLSAGCCYEYARESHKLRCFLVLLELKRKRELTGPLFFEISKQPTRWGLYLIESGWEEWLGTFTSELARNLSFAGLLRTSPVKVKESLEVIDSYSLFPKAVQSPGRHVEYPGSEIIPIQFFWRDYNNEEIGEETARLAGKLRPASEPEPVRRGKGKKSEIKSLLDALSVMRIWKRFPLACDLSRRIREVGLVTDYKGCNDYVEAHREAFRAGRYKPPTDKAETEMSKARKHALTFFQSIFEGEMPANY